MNLHAWAPDGEALVVAGRRPDDWLAPHDRVMVVAGDVLRELFVAHDMTISLSWSPDGRTIAWCGREHEPDSGQIVLAAADGSTPPQMVQKDFPGSLEWLGHRPDGRIAFAAVVGLRVGFYSLAGDGNDLRTEHAPESFAPGSLGSGSFTTLSPSFSSDGAMFVTTVSGPGEPANLVAGPWGGRLQRITALNPAAAGWALGTREDAAWKSADGLEIQGLLLLPPGFDPARKYPLVVEIHGGPRRSWWATSLLTDATWAGWLASRGYVVLLPNPRGSEGRGAGFVRMNTRDLGGGDLRDVLAGADMIVARGFIDQTRTAVAGWSYGGFLAAWAITQTPRFQAAVIGAGITNWISREGASASPGLWGRLHWLDARIVWNEPALLASRSPVTFGRQVRTPALFLHGLADTNVPPGQAREFYGALRSHGVPTEAVFYPGEGHVLHAPANRADSLRRIESWLARHLPAPAISL